MLAAVYRGRGDVRVQEWPAPGEPPPGWVSVAVHICGICGTDLDEISHGPMLLPIAPHPLTGRNIPIVMGHEGMGEVIAAGQGVAIPVGTRVGLENTVGCTACAQCLRGMPQLCPRMAVIGLMLDGALAQIVNVPASMCVPLPPSVSDEAGALAEPLSVAVRAVRRGGGVEGRNVHVVGAGTIGLFTAQVARVRGARSVTLSEPHAGRRRTALELGFDAAPTNSRTPIASIVYECTGTPTGFADAIARTDHSGTTVVVGLHARPHLLDLHSLVIQERSIVASLSHEMENDYRPAVELLASGAIQYEPLISGLIPLAKVVEDGFTAMVRSPDKHMKVLVECRG